MQCIKMWVINIICQLYCACKDEQYDLILKFAEKHLSNKFEDLNSINESDLKTMRMAVAKHLMLYEGKSLKKLVKNCIFILIKACYWYGCKIWSVVFTRLKNTLSVLFFYLKFHAT